MGTHIEGGRLPMRRRCGRGKKYWAIVAVSRFLVVAIALLLGGIGPEALRWPIGWVGMGD